MPNGTDTRIVQMQFDNRQFEKNIKTSEKSLERFKKYLNFEACEKSLSKFGKAAEQLTFDKMADNLQKLTDKFTGLGTASELIISQIRHGLESAAASARRFVNSLTLDQVNAGFDKFGKLNKQVQTIMAATSRSEKDVYNVLKRLNDYTDQTSYNFVDMAANIGKFTSVGIGLEDAEKQMEGIANWAARSGGGIQEASRAMYNLSQAMGVGALTKIDWKSIENAGMATKEFKEQLIQAGLATGQLVKENGKVMTAKSLGKQIEVTYQNLAETLSKKWANTEVMQKSFMAYYYEDLYYTGEITSGIKTTKEQRDELRKLVTGNEKIGLEDWEKMKAESDKIRNDLLSSEEIDHSEWEKLNIDSEANRQKIIEAAAEQKKLLKEVNEEGYTVYKTLAKDGKQIEITTENFDELLKRGVVDETLLTVVFGLDMDPLIETTEEQKQALKDSLATDDVILKKDWVENISAAGLANDEFKQAAMDAAVAAGTLKKETDKAGNTIYKTAKGFGKETVVNLQNFEETLKNKWFTGEVADKAVKLNDLGKAAYESAQKCMTFTDVIEAWRDQLSTGWMNSYTKIFGELSESMELFSNICNKVGEAFSNLIDLRNGILDIWGEGGGRENLWALLIGEVTDEGEAVAYEGAYGFLDVLGDIGNMISTAFWETLKMFADPGGQLNWDENGYKEAWIASTLDYAILSVREFLSTIREFFNASAEGSKKSRWQEIQDVVNAIFATFVLAESVIRDVMTGISILLDQAHFGPAIDALLHMFSELGLTISSSAQDAERGHGLIYLFRQLDVTCRPLISALNELIVTFADLIAEFLKTGRENGDFKAFWDVVVSGINSLAAIITKYGTPIIKFFTSFIGTVGRLLQNGINTDNLVIAGQELKASLKTMLDSLFDGIPNFSERVSALWDTIKNWFANGFKQEDWEALKAKLKSALKTVLGILPEGWGESITSTYNSLKASFGEFVEKIKGFFKSVVEAFKAGFSAESIAKIGEKAKSLWSSVVNAIPEGIGEAVVNAYNAVVKYVKDLWGRIVGFFNSLFGGGKENPVDNVVTQMLPGEKAKNAVADAKKNNVFEQIISYLSTSFANLKTNFQLLLGNDKGDAGSFGEALKQLDWGKIMVVLIGALGGVGIITVIAKIVGIVKLFLGALETVKNLVDEGIKIGPEAKKADIGEKMLKIAGAVAILVACLTVVANLEAADAWNALTIIGILSAVLVAMTMMMSYMYKDSSLQDAGSLALSVIAMAVAIGRIIAAILPLKDIDSPWKWLSMFVGLAAIVGAMFALGKVAKSGSLSFKDTAGVLGFCVGIWLVIQALFKIKDLEPIQFIKMFGSLAIILIEIFGFAKLLTKFGGGLANTGMKEAAFLAAAVGILVFSLTSLAKLRFDQLMQAVFGLTLILAALFGFIVGVNKLAQGGLKDTGMAQLIAVAGSIIMLVLALMPLALMKPNQIEQMLVPLLVIMTTLFLFIAGVNNMAKGGLKDTGMAQLIAVAGSIMMIMLALMPLAIMRPDQIEQMLVPLLVILTGLFLFIAGVNNMAKGGLKDTGMTQLLAVAGAIALVVLALMPLALMEWDELARMGAGFVVIMVMFSGIIAAAHKLKPEGAASTFLLMIGVAALMYIFALSLTKIPKDMNWEKIAAFGGGLALIIAAVALAMKLGKGIDLYSSVGIILTIAGVLAAIIGVVALLGPMLMNRIGSSMQTMSAQFSLIGGMIVDFMGYMNSVSESDLESAKRKFAKLYEIIESLKDVSKYTGVIHQFSECCLLLGSGLHQFIFSTSTVGDPEQSNGIKLLEKILGYRDRLANFTGAAYAANQMSLLGGGLTSFNAGAGNIENAETPAFQMLDKLLGYGDKFSSLNGAFTAAIQIMSLGAGLNVFSTQSGSITDSNPAALQLLTNMAGNADSLEKLTKINLTGFADQMSGLGGALSIYALGVKESAGIEIGDVPDVSGAIAILTSLTQGLSNDMGELAIPEMPDEDTLTGFGTQLAALAGGLIQFSKASEGLGDYQKALDVLTFMKGLKQDLNPENLKVVNSFSEAEIYSTYTLTSFGNEISALGSSLKSYNGSIKGFTKNKAALDVLDFMVQLKGKLNDGDLKVVNAFKDAGITSVTTISTFGDHIAALGNSMKSYNDSVKDFKENKDATKAIEFFWNLQEKFLGHEINKALFTMFTGQGITEQTLSTFGTDIGALGEALAGFASNVNFSKVEGQKNDFDNALVALDMLQKMAIALPKYNGLHQIINGENLKLSELAEDIRSLGESLGQFSDELSAVGKNSGKTYDVDLVKGALEAVQVVVEMATAMTQVDNFAGFTAYNYADTLTEIVRSMQDVPDFMDFDQHGSFIDSVVAFMKRFQDAANDVGGIGDSTIFVAFTNLASGIQKMAQTNPAFDFKQIGLNMDAGIEAGIKEGSINVAETAAAMAYRAYLAAKAAINSNSPSKLFMSLGSFASEGMAIGITKSADQAANASESMANSTIDSARGVLANISSILANDVDAQPTIRPVLDLSNVTAGARQINGIFGDTYGLGIDPSGARARASRTYAATEAVAVDQNGIDSYGALARLDAMLENVQKMGESISNMKLVLDTGVVAGGVSDDVDLDIGRKMFYAERRN